VKRTAFATLVATTFLATAAYATPVTQTFGPVYDFDDGPGSVSATLSGLSTSISGNLTVDFSVIGDLDWSTEYFDLTIDGTAFGRGCDNNTGNDTFGITSDSCSQSANGFRTGQLVIDNTTAVGLLSDGILNIAFAFTNAVNDFVSITQNRTLSGVTFVTSNNLSFAAGGTVSYNSPPEVPLPAGLPLLLAGLGAFGVARRVKAKKA
jgi:hypothetical protein